MTTRRGLLTACGFLVALWGARADAQLDSARAAVMGLGLGAAKQDVWLRVNGRAVTRLGKLRSTDSLEFGNGILTLRRNTQNDEQLAGIVASGSGLLGLSGPLSSDVYGDYTYVGSSVVTEPTDVEVLRFTQDEVTVRWTFGSHRLAPKAIGMDSSLADLLYPFTKTVWLRRGVSGYWALVKPLVPLPPSRRADEFEHEIGLGGLWGQGKVTMPRREVRTDTLLRTVRIVRADLTAYAVWQRDGDPIRRLMVPMPGRALLIPRFSNVQFGSVWALLYRPEQFGAFLHFSAASSEIRPGDVCIEAAWNAPTEFRLTESRRDLEQACNASDEVLEPDARAIRAREARRKAASDSVRMRAP